jgi:hypothetical protein
MSLRKGLILATAAATLFTATQSFATEAINHNEKPVKCFGINSCRGKGSCGMKGMNGCAGQNTCKGKGWLYLKSEQECKSRGGQVIKE